MHVDGDRTGSRLAAGILDLVGERIHTDETSGRRINHPLALHARGAAPHRGGIHRNQGECMTVSVVVIGHHIHGDLAIDALAETCRIVGCIRWDVHRGHRAEVFERSQLGIPLVESFSQLGATHAGIVVVTVDGAFFRGSTVVMAEAPVVTEFVLPDFVEVAVVLTVIHRIGEVGRDDIHPCETGPDVGSGNAGDHIAVRGCLVVVPFILQRVEVSAAG